MKIDPCTVPRLAVVVYYSCLGLVPFRSAAAPLYAQAVVAWPHQFQNTFPGLQLYSSSISNSNNILFSAELDFYLRDPVPFSFHSLMF